MVKNKLQDFFLNYRFLRKNTLNRLPLRRITEFACCGVQNRLHGIAGTDHIQKSLISLCMLNFSRVLIIYMDILAASLGSP